MSAKAQNKTEPPATDVVTIEVNGKPLQAKKGSMVIQVTDAAGIYIPRFCYHHKLSVAANCRMCLVEVEKTPKPVPACATPVADGMKVFTQSELARDAQKGVMEFLLINHPLDCPICDQGGECPLQDLALGYGKDVSRYAEKKRVVDDKDIGPLIATDMTRCIHCTRCVRFGQEIAGIMELGATGRGEHTEIGTFIERSVDSELSGNVIDLCPVGALTSKPYRFTARAWELINHDAISPHDCVGSNLNVQVRHHKVMRVLPRENEAINECWLSDRDRYSYEAVNSEERLQVPMIRENGRWTEVDWNTALAFAVTGLRKVMDEHGPDQLGALAAPTSTLEEFYLLQKLMRSLGSANVDHRLRQLDFSDDDNAPVFPWLGQSIEDLDNLEALLLVGSNVRKDQPILGHRVRKASRKGARIMAINPVDYDLAFKLAHKVVTDPANMKVSLARVAKVLAAGNRVIARPAPAWMQSIEPGQEERAIADVLARHDRVAVLLGNFAASHPEAAQLRALAELVAELASANLGFLCEANSAGGWLAGCVPHRGPTGHTARAGRHAHAMISDLLKGYILLGVEPELDCLDGQRTRQAMETADFVVMLSPFKPSPATTNALAYANVLLPLTPFTETAGTFVNCEGRLQAFGSAAPPLGEARPGWKILRVLGNLFGQPGFDYVRVEDIRTELDLADLTPSAELKQRTLPDRLDGEVPELVRITEVPIYAIDNLVRRAPALQKSADNPPPAARMNSRQVEQLRLTAAGKVIVRMLDGETTLDLIVDARIPDRCALVPAGYPETSALGPHGAVSVSRAERT
ncbi:MAG: NADH-quinone oxidoreductase subunit NuoG [Acidiferrobacterales bacterium]